MQYPVDSFLFVAIWQAARIETHSDSDFYVAIISFHEQLNGWSAFVNKSTVTASIARAYQKFELLISNYANAQVSPFSEEAAEVFDDLRAKKVRVGTMDLRIASIAIANQMTLLTRNTVDFERVDDLMFDDWLAN